MKIYVNVNLWYASQTPGSHWVQESAISSPNLQTLGIIQEKSLRVSSDFHRAEVLKIFATAFSSVSGLVGGSRFTMDWTMKNRYMMLNHWFLSIQLGVFQKAARINLLFYLDGWKIRSLKAKWFGRSDQSCLVESKFLMGMS